MESSHRAKCGASKQFVQEKDSEHVSASGERTLVACWRRHSADANSSCATERFYHQIKFVSAECGDQHARGARSPEWRFARRSDFVYHLTNVRQTFQAEDCRSRIHVAIARGHREIRLE